jgi:uncharacterized protein YlzI (FlbEa/FlbD family)
MLIEFTRVPRVDHLGDDNEEEEGVQEVRISINPENVAAVFAARGVPDTCVVRMSDGRGFIIQGNYDEVMTMLRPYHQATAVTPPLRAV